MDPVRDRDAMIKGLTPVLVPGEVVFVTLAEASKALDLLADALAIFLEDEGVSMILSCAVAARHGFDVAQPMRRIVLNVYSALDGVGLTAAVSHVLAQAGIACNMVAAFHHDHVFVPTLRADEALALLAALQAKA